MRRTSALGWILVVSLCLVYLVGCAGAPTISDGAVYKDVQVFFTTPDRPYEVIGDCSAGSFWTGTTGEAMGNLCNKAKKLGGDAVINVKVIKGFLSPAKAVGTVVKWKQEGPVSEEPEVE